MNTSEERKAREVRQERASQVVWGSLLMTAGVLFTLHNMGTIDLLPAPGLAASKAVDGDRATRWSSRFEDPQTLTVDLGAPVAVGRVALHWEEAHAKAYQVQASTDGESWTTLKEVRDGDGGTDEHEVSATARYVRVLGQARATPYGYSLFELEVFGPAAPGGAGALLSRDRPATASSVESANPWALYWPLFLVAGGLPALFAPKDAGNRVFGFLLTGAGAALQLRNLGHLTLDFKMVVAAALILGGLALVLQSRKEPDAGAASGPGGPGRSL